MGAGRLEGWKAIAQHLGRTVRTVQRWEREQQLPVHRLLHNCLSTVYADPRELDDWRQHWSSVAADDAVDDERTLVYRGSRSEARVLYHMSRQHLRMRTLDDLRRSIALAKAALERDPEYAAAQAGLALSYVTMATYTPGPPAEFIELGRAAAERALALDVDGGLADAYTALGCAALCFDWKWDAAVAAFERAVHVDPRNATAHQWLSVVQLVMNRPVDACRTNRLAAKLDPASLTIASQLGWLLYFRGHYDAAVSLLQGLIQQRPQFWGPYFNLGLCLNVTGRAGDAARAFEIAAALNEHPAIHMARASSLAVLDRRAALAAVRLVQRASTYVPSYWLAYAQMGLGGDATALAHLEKAVANREWHVVLVKHEPAFGRLRGHDRFMQLTERVGLP